MNVGKAFIGGVRNCVEAEYVIPPCLIAGNLVSYGIQVFLCLTMTFLMAMVDDEFMVNLVSYICVYGVLM